MGLTSQEEEAIQFFMQGNDKTASYKMAGYGGSSSSKTLNENACRFFKRNKIVARIKELNDAITEKFVVDRQYVTEGIIRSIEIAEKNGDASNMRQGFAELSKLYDLSEEKHNDRLISQRDKEAVIENLRARLIDVTPEE